MSDAVLFSCPRCGAYRHLAARPTDERVRCLGCEVFSPHDGRLFGRPDWKATNDPFRMAEVLAALEREPGVRKRRLLTCGFGRTVFDWCRNPWFRDALDAAETWADAGERPNGVPRSRVKLRELDVPGQSVPDGSSLWALAPWSRDRLERLGWVRVALRATDDDPRLWPNDVAPANRAVAAALVRDLVPNPFGSPEWNPEWSTAAARDLAEYIYTRRAFDVMPILADALQDAGCENARVLNHCRADKTHARGCWVLDAILGLS